MKEWGEHLTKAQEEYEKHKDHFIGKEGDYVCTFLACSKVWYPVEPDDVNRKRPSTFYRLCSSCRLKSFTKAREYKAKKKDRETRQLQTINNLC